MQGLRAAAAVWFEEEGEEGAGGAEEGDGESDGALRKGLTGTVLEEFSFLCLKERGGGQLCLQPS